MVRSSRNHRIAVLIERPERTGHAIQSIVVKHDQHPVDRPAKVDLTTIRAAIHRGGVGLQCVLRGEGPRAAMHDHDRPEAPFSDLLVARLAIFSRLRRNGGDVVDVWYCPQAAVCPAHRINTLITRNLLILYALLCYDVKAPGN